MKTTGIIYLIRNKIDGKVYVGQTDTPLKRRWNKHRYDAARGADWHFSRAIRKHGKEAFELSVLETLPIEQLNEAEIKWIAHFDSFKDEDKGYNSTAGGHGLRGYKHTEEAKEKAREAKLGDKNPMFGKPMSEDHRRSISDAHIGKPKSAEHRANMSKARAGVPLSKEHAAKISELKRGNKYRLGKRHTEETKQVIREKKTGHKQSSETIAKRKATMEARGGSPMKGVKMSEESRRKMSAAQTGRIQSPETRAKIAAGNKGKVVSDETRLLISLAQRGEKHHNFGKTASLETRQKRSASLKGRPAHPNSLANLGKHDNTGHKHTAETKEAIGAYWRGRTRSEETRRKMSEARKRTAARKRAEKLTTKQS